MSAAETSDTRSTLLEALAHLERADGVDVAMLAADVDLARAALLDGPSEFAAYRAATVARAVRFDTEATPGLTTAERDAFAADVLEGVVLLVLEEGCRR